MRWGQTYFDERHPSLSDIAWWREYWRQTSIQGVVINAGGIVAYYPSKFPLHRRAEFLNDSDLYGEHVRIAHEDGLTVLARVDSSMADEEFFRAHPNWFARKESGEPYRQGDMYWTCINSPYHDEYMPAVLEEIIERAQPEGIIEAGWNVLTRDNICHCENCARRFRDKVGLQLPTRKDWNDQRYRQWIQWNYERRIDLWEFNNRISKAAGGPQCLWLVMIYDTGIVLQSRLFYDLREFASRSEFIPCVTVARADDDSGFQRNGDIGKQLNQLTGWGKVIIQTVALCQAVVIADGSVGKMSAFLNEDPRAVDLDTLVRSLPALGNEYGLAAKPEPEARMWAIEGIAGGLAPWWSTVSADSYDRRMYRTPEPIFGWHRENEQYLTNRRPIASVGVIWSQRNTDYFGRDDAVELVEAPYRGFINALIRARIPYLPVNARDIEQQGEGLSVLILPNVGGLSDEECDALRQFVLRGGSLVASGASSLYDEWGDPRPDFALADLFGAHAPREDFGRVVPRRSFSYLRLTTELSHERRSQAWAGPSLATRHAVLRGFEETELIPFGGELEEMKIDKGTVVPLTFIPAVVHPGGRGVGRMSEPRSNVPGLVLNVVGEAHVAYLAADIDRRFAEDGLPDHGDLLANIVRWAAGDQLDFHLQGPGLIDCHVYYQAGRVIVHLVNLTNQGTWRSPVRELLPVGPFTLTLELPADVPGRGVDSLVAKSSYAITVHGGRASLQIPTIVDHEMLVIQ